MNYNIIYFDKVNNKVVDIQRNIKLEPLTGSAFMGSDYTPYMIKDKQYRHINQHTIEVTAILENLK